MRKALQAQLNGERKYKIIGVDDENGILDSLRGSSRKFKS